MFTPNTAMEEALRFSRFDSEHLLATSTRSILLEDELWTSAEHYVHCMLAGNASVQQKIREAKTGLAAYKISKSWFSAKKPGWKDQRKVYMTRAIYTLVQMYPDIKEYLLETGEKLLAESSQYDHFWGIGRDLRGENTVGKVWMDVREKLRKD